MPSSRVSSQHRDRTLAFLIAGRFFTSWATWEALLITINVVIVHFSCCSSVSKDEVFLFLLKVKSSINLRSSRSLFLSSESLLFVFLPGMFYLCFCGCFFLSFSSGQPLSRVWLFATPWTAAHQASLSITNSWILFTHVHWVSDALQPSHPRRPLSSRLQSFPASGSFPRSPFVTSGGQRIGVSASASVLPMNIQDWFPIGLTGWISLQPKRLSRVFSNNTVQKHPFFSDQFFFIVQLSHLYMTTGKTRALTR